MIFNQYLTKNTKFLRFLSFIWLFIYISHWKRENKSKMLVKWYIFFVLWLVDMVFSQGYILKTVHVQDLNMLAYINHLNLPKIKPWLIKYLPTYDTVIETMIIWFILSERDFGRIKPIGNTKFNKNLLALVRKKRSL